MALRLDENCPARAEAAEGIVEATGDSDQFGGHGRIEVRSAKARRALEAAILVEDDAFADQRRPWQEIGKAAVAVAIFCEVHHRRGLAQTEKWAGIRRW